MKMKKLLPVGRHREWWFYHAMPLIFFIGTLFFFSNKNWSFLYWLIFIGYYLCTFSVILAFNNLFVLHHSKEGDEMGVSITILIILIIVGIGGIVINETSTLLVWSYFIGTCILTYMTINVFSKNSLNQVPFAKDEFNTINTKKEYVKTQIKLDKNLNNSKTKAKYGEV